MADSALADILLLGLARQDALAFRKLANDREMGDALVGFHAQQAVEKALKAVLDHVLAWAEQQTGRT